MKIDTTHRLVDLDPRDPQFFENPYPTYRRLHAECPVFKWQQYGHWCFSKHEDVNALLRDRRFGRQILHLVSREELGWPEPPEHIKVFTDHEQHSLLELEPPVHTRLRGLISRAFLSRQIERLRPFVADVANKLIDGFEGDQVDILEAFATPVPVYVICELLGAPQEMAQQFLAWSHDHVAMYMAKRDRAIEDKAVAAVSAFSAYMRKLIAERRKNLGQDLLSELIRAESEGQKLSEDELVTTAILVLNAGHEATVHATGNGIKAMLERGIHGPITPELVDEMMRFDPPLHMFTRYALEDIEFAGVNLKKGDTVGLMLGAANHDAEKFANPEQFDVTRAPNPHVAFGAGIHFCIGAPLARLEMQAALEVLFARFPNMSLAGEPHYKDVYHFHGLEALRVNLR